MAIVAGVMISHDDMMVIMLKSGGDDMGLDGDCVGSQECDPIGKGV